MRSVLGCALLCMLASTGAATEAADPREQNRLQYLAGLQAFQLGRNDLAISSWEAVYRSDPTPAIHFNLGQAYRRRFLVDHASEDLKRAVDHYRQYLKDAPTAANHELASQALDGLTPVLLHLDPAALGRAPEPPQPPEPRTELLVVTEAEGATIELDGGQAEAAPRLVEVTPGAHRARVSAPGYFPMELKLTAVLGRLVSAEARLLPRPGELVVTGDRGASLYVDGQAHGRLPVPPLQLVAGSHTVELVERGHALYSADVAVDRGGVARLVAAPPVTARRRAARWVGVAAGAAALFASAGAAVWGGSDSTAASLDQRRVAHSLTSAELADYDTAHTMRDDWRTVTGVAIGAAGVLALTSVLLNVLDVPRPRVRPR